MGYRERIKEWWDENKEVVLATLDEYNTDRKSVRLPVMIDGVIDVVEYEKDTGKISISAYVATSKDVTPAGWNDTSVYTDEAEWRLVIEEER